jgi:hypothetical protein
MGPATSARTRGWRGRNRSSDRNGLPAAELRPADADWSINRQSAAQSAPSGQLGAMDSADVAERHEMMGREPGSTSDSWRDVGPGRPGEPVGTPELVSRTVRTD